MLPVPLIERFVAKDKRERIAFLAGKPARRDDLRDALLHDTRSLARATMTPIAADIPAILAALRAKPAAMAYAISDILELDDRELPLGEALALAVGRSRDTMIACIATARAYYENHEGERYILADQR